MRSRIINGIVWSAMIVTGLTLACDQPNSHIPTGPSVPGLNSLDIVGPASITPGQPAQLTASLRLSDGTVKTNAAETSVLWRSSNPAVLQVGPTGLLSPMAPQGEATITAESHIGTGPTRKGSREFIVQPPGTFRLVGKITEEGTSPALSVGGARVEVEPGSPFAMADAFGQYRLYGVPPAADIRISAGSYATQSYPVQLSGNSTRNFTIALSGPRPSLAGDYVLFIDSAGDCGNSLSTSLQHRSYQATIAQNGITLDVVLTEPRFRVNNVGHGNRFSGQATGGGATFSLNTFGGFYYYYYYGPASFPSVVELLPDGRHLVVYGSAATTGSSSGLNGSMSGGGMVLWDARYPVGSILGSCFGTFGFRLDPR